MDLNCETAVVLGHGNVALDVARVLLMPVEILAVSCYCCGVLQMNTCSCTLTNVCHRVRELRVWPFFKLLCHMGSQVLAVSCCYCCSVFQVNNCTLTNACRRVRELCVWSFFKLPCLMGSQIPAMSCCYCCGVLQMNNCTLTNACHRVRELRVWPFFRLPCHMGSHMLSSEDLSPLLEGGCCHARRLSWLKIVPT